ncbi:Peroxiredoxin [Flavobacteriaceae bacterium MAR_2010_188]|nr:Peroxiredoxin [Flavobacteriaceae bacterium MAR_2010_188]
MKNIIPLIILTILLIGCKESPEQKDTANDELTIGDYRGALAVKDNKELPFLFHVYAKDSLVVYNADEEIEVTDVQYKNDSVYITLPAFEGYLVAKIEDENLNGSFVKESLDRIVPFTAEKNITERFKSESKSNLNVSGSWETVFSKGVEGDEYIAKGIFKQEGQKVTGTFRTTTGDYRFLEGVMDGNNLKLSAFDGAHAFLFEAVVSDSTMNGTFYSGNHWKEPFTAVRNETYELPNADGLTALKEGYDTLEFTFPDLQGNPVSISDKKFEDKVVIVQVMGSWCPNCLDETNYYTKFYKDQKPANVEFVALAFEYAKTKQSALASLNRLKTDANIPYPILLAQYGSSDKEEAQRKLPMLDKVLSYPTTIFVDKKGKVRKIHTGFNGPATGEKYTEFQKEFKDFVAMLSAE